MLSRPGEDRRLLTPATCPPACVRAGDTDRTAASLLAAQEVCSSLQSLRCSLQLTKCLKVRWLTNEAGGEVTVSRLNTHNVEHCIREGDIGDAQKSRGSLSDEGEGVLASAVSFAGQTV